MQLEEVAAELEQHRPAILAYLSRVLGQDTSGAGRYRPGDLFAGVSGDCAWAGDRVAALRPWLCRIARNVAIDLWRHRTCVTLVPLDEMESPQQDSLEDRVIERTRSPTSWRSYRLFMRSVCCSIMGMGTQCERSLSVSR